MNGQVDKTVRGSKFSHCGEKYRIKVNKYPRYLQRTTSRSPNLYRACLLSPYINTLNELFITFEYIYKFSFIYLSSTLHIEIQQENNSTLHTRAVHTSKSQR